MDRTGPFISAAFGIAVLVAAPAVAQKIYDPGARDTEIKVGQTKPYSGPVSAYATVGRAGAPISGWSTSRAASRAGRSS